jgi:glycosyltransferase involved in cell wall biosynthesis
MKIGFYGNANNYPFMLARAMRRAGHEVMFLIVSQADLNRPEKRYHDITLPYPSWIEDVSHPLRWRTLLPGPKRDLAVARLNSCDFVFLNEEGPSLADRLTVPYAAISTGSDLQVFANPARITALRTQVTAGPRWVKAIIAALFPERILHHLLLEPQRTGFRGARFVTHFARGLVPEGDRMLDELGITDQRRVFVMMTDLELIPLTPPRNSARLRTFCATRLTWKHEKGSDLTSIDYKGSDTMIRGIGLFWRKTGIPLDIHLVRKGRHVEETVQLAEQEGISSLITWHNEMTQQDVQRHFEEADIVFEQFGESFVAMAGLDAMATGRPLIANWRPEIFDVVLGETSPVCHATDAPGVCNHLEKLVADPALRARIGRDGRRFVERHFSSDAAARRCLERVTLEGRITR